MTTTDLATSRQGYDKAVRTARDYVCADCGNVLLVRWCGDRYAANCGRYPEEHEHIRSHAEIQQADTRERLERSPQLARSMVPTREVALTTQAIKELDNEKLMARVPDRYGSAIEVSRPMKIQLAQLARIYGLDPLWDLMLYEGRPYVTYDGRLRKLREHPEYRGHKVRPLGKTEKEEWGYETADLVIQCDIDMGPRGVITDWGIVRATEVTAALEKAKRDNKRAAPVGVHTQQIAIKRAVYRASKQAVGIDLPTIIEAGGRVVDVQEVPPRGHPLPAGDAEAQSRRRFWSIARGSPPDGLGLDDAEIHELLGVETLANYQGGWDQALSDLTEKAAAEIDPGDLGEGGWAEASASDVNGGPAAMAEPEPVMVTKARSAIMQKLAERIEEAAAFDIDITPYAVELPAPQVDVEDKLQRLAAAVMEARKAVADADPEQAKAF